MKKEVMEKPMFQVVAFYKYVHIADAEVFTAQHLKYCKSLGIGSRIYIAEEGINGQLSGTPEQCQQYMDDLRKDARFADVDFKVDFSDKKGFRKTHVRLKNEIVNSGLIGLQEVNPIEKQAKHIDAFQFKELKDKPNVVVIDMRSNYETRIGRFKNAITFDIEHFRDFPEKLEEIKDEIKDKTILTYCTGGIKCEKGALYLEKMGFKDVYQLEGGIIKYAKETGGEDFEGQCYVFDERVVVDVNTVNPNYISHCIHCDTATARTINCASDICNDQIVMCEDCGWKWDGACSEKCKSAEDIRPYDGTGYYVKRGLSMQNLNK